MTVIVISAVSSQVLMSLAKTLYVVVEVGQTCGLLMEEFEILLAEIQLKVFPPKTEIWIVSPSQITASFDVVRTGNGLTATIIVSFFVQPLFKLPVKI